MFSADTFTKSSLQVELERATLSGCGCQLIVTPLIADLNPHQTPPISHRQTSAKHHVTRFAGHQQAARSKVQIPSPTGNFGPPPGQRGT